jgi:hypothetical protein
MGAIGWIGRPRGDLSADDLAERRITWKPAVALGCYGRTVRCGNRALQLELRPLRLMIYGFNISQLYQNATIIAYILSALPVQRLNSPPFAVCRIFLSILGII